MELIICIVILSLLAAIAATRAGKFDEDVKIAAAMKDMRSIQRALMERLYPDLGFIPCGIDASSSDDRRALEPQFVPTYLFMERSELQKALKDPDCLKEGYVSDYDKYRSVGWRGPYMRKPSGMIDATYFDPDGFRVTNGNHVHLDALLTPWAQECEGMAEEAEKEGNADLALEYRKGKYYQIFYPQITLTSPVWGANHLEGYIVGWTSPACEIPKDNAYIVSRGPDCLPPKARGPDLTAILKCISQIKEKALSEEACGKITGASIAQAGSVAGMRACVKERFEHQFPECFEDRDAVPLERRLSIKNPGHPYYIDLGDDLLMSLSGKVVRSPLDR
jgi:hypothetical protein